MTKDEFERLSQKYSLDADPDGLGCISSKEWKIMQDYKEIFGDNLPVDNVSWEQREYAYREGKKGIAGEAPEKTLSPSLFYPASTECKVYHKPQAVNEF